MTTVSFKSQFPVATYVREPPSWTTEDGWTSTTHEIGCLVWKRRDQQTKRIQVKYTCNKEVTFAKI
jgi:hypothetical protein